MKPKTRPFIPLTFVLVGLIGFLPWTNPVNAQVPKVTASEVVDKESLKGFVTWATSEFAAVTDINAGSRLIQEFRTENSDWNVGNMYLILFTLDGQVFLHGKDPNADGRNAAGTLDDDGKKVVAEIITADATGKFVEWCWDDPLDTNDVRCKDSYAMRYHSLVAGVDFVVVGGYYQDLSSAGDPLPSFPLPTVQAADVVDRETLKQFVSGSLEWLGSLVGEVGFSRATEWKQLLREEGGPFKSGPIYLYIITPEGYVIFHGGDPWREGRTVLDNTDFQGRPFVRDLVQAAQQGGGFVEYFWDDPTVQGDEDTGTPKVAYALSLKNDLPVFQGFEFIIAGGFYRNFSTAEAESAASDWLIRFGRSVASQAMEMIGNRVSLTNDRENHVALAGGNLNINRLLNPGTLAAISANGASAIIPTSRGRLLDGTSFQVSPGGSSGGDGYAVWGSGEFASFKNRDGTSSTEGEVTTAALGADYAFGRVLTGIAVTYSDGSGKFDIGRPGQDDIGDLASNLTSAFPYARFSLGERLLTYSVLGYGVGTLSVGGGGEDDVESDLSMRMAGIGLKGDLLQSDDPRGIKLAIRSDAFITSLNSKAVEQRGELTSNASRLRVGIEASKAFATGQSSVFRPQFRAAMRYDGGDVDTGFGVEMGGGLNFSAVESGITVSVNGRTLLAHEQSDLEDWGIGGAITFNPGGEGRGLSVNLRPSWGSTASGLARLWSQGAMHMVNGNYGGRRLDAEVGYGIESRSDQARFMPYARIALLQQPDFASLTTSGTAHLFAAVPFQNMSQDAYSYQLGGRLALATGLAASFEAGRSEWLYDSRPYHTATVNVSFNL